jgi:hypothetical protein
MINNSTSFTFDETSHQQTVEAYLQRDISYGFNETTVISKAMKKLGLTYVALHIWETNHVKKITNLVNTSNIDISVLVNNAMDSPVFINHHNTVINRMNELNSALTSLEDFYNMLTIHELACLGY